MRNGGSDSPISFMPRRIACIDSRGGRTPYAKENHVRIPRAYSKMKNCGELLSGALYAKDGGAVRGLIWFPLPVNLLRRRRAPWF